MKHNKKAFTVVELVIVIAILAILAAVLIPTFVGLVEKANESNTLKLVKNLNTALRADKPDVASDKHETMYDALMAAKGFGYDVEKINANKSATGDNEILWDSVNDCFVYVRGNDKVYAPETLKVKDVAPYQYWTISDTVSETYSTYLYGFTGTEITAKAGIDAGEITGITKINYVGNTTAQTVAIRTNGGTLTVDAPLDIVHHYGAVDKAVVEKIADASYHENGKVAVSLEVKAGHVVVEPSAVIKEVLVPENAAASTKVDIKENSTVATIVVDSTAATVEVKENAKVDNVIASDANANVKVPASVEASKTEKFEVSSEDELKEALINGKKYIVVTADFDLRNTISVTADVTIDGQNHIITANGATRMLWIENNKVSLVIKNLTFDSANTCERGIQVNVGFTEYDIMLNNVKFINNVDYAINMTKNTSGKFVAVNCEFSGWSALNTWGSGHNIRFNDSTLVGTNDKNEGSSNDFATICLEADTTDKTNEYSSGNTVTLTNCTVKAIETNTNYQRIVAFNGGIPGAVGNTVISVNCKFEFNREKVVGGGNSNTWEDNGEVVFEN